MNHSTKDPAAERFEEAVELLVDRVWQEGSKSAGGFHMVGQTLKVAEAIPPIRVAADQYAAERVREELEEVYEGYRQSTGLAKYNAQDPFSAVLRDRIAALEQTVTTTSGGTGEDRNKPLDQGVTNGMEE